MRYLAVTWVLICAAMRIQAQNQQLFRADAKETALGAQLASQVLTQTTPLGLKSVDQYLQNLGQRIAEQMPYAADGKWSFVAIQDHKGGSTCEPISLPGGYVFVSAQLILGANSEAELAGMLAHSIAHVVEMHAARLSHPGALNPSASIPLIFIGGAGASGDDEGNLVPLALSQARRQQELQADQFAVEAMAAAGYDPHALLNFIERRQAQDKTSSPLPPLPLRTSNLEQAIQRSSAPTLQAAVASFHAVQKAVTEKLANGPHPRS